MSTAEAKAARRTKFEGVFVKIRDELAKFGFVCRFMEEIKEISVVGLRTEVDL